MSRKSKSFGQLYDYFAREDRSGFFVSWNLQHPLNREKVLEQFYRNSRCLNARKRGNVLYHEIISLKLNPDIHLDRQVRALHDLSLKYLQSRAPESLGFGRLHSSQGHIHIHLMLSSNGLNQERRHRLSKAEFAAVQLLCEQYLQQAYPDLGQSAVYDGKQRSHPSKTRQRESEFKKRTGDRTKKEQIRHRLIELLKQTPSQDLAQWLRQHGFELYQRGKSFGVVHEGKKYRLSTLGVDDAFCHLQTGKPESTPEEDPISKSTSLSAKQQRQDDLEEAYRRMEREIEAQTHSEKNERENNEPDR